MNQCAAGKAQQRFGVLALGLRMPVEAVLVDRVLDALGKVGLQLDGRDRQAIKEEDEVKAVLIALRVAHLPHDAQAVRRVACHDVRVDARGRAKLRQGNLALYRKHLDAVPQYVECSACVQSVAEAGRAGGIGCIGRVLWLIACHASGCDSCTHAITSSGNNARALSYCAETPSS